MTIKKCALGGKLEVPSYHTSRLTELLVAMLLLAGNKETVADLLVAFFDYWAWRHDYNNMVASVRTGGLVTKAAKNWCGPKP
jgi:DNA polymerase sigma